MDEMKAKSVTIDMADIQKDRPGPLGRYTPKVTLEGFWTMKDVRKAQQALERGYKRWRGDQRRAAKGLTPTPQEARNVT